MFASRRAHERNCLPGNRVLYTNGGEVGDTYVARRGLPPIAQELKRSNPISSEPSNRQCHSSKIGIKQMEFFMHITEATDE